MIFLRCHPREIFGLVDEIKRLRERLAAVEALREQWAATTGNGKRDDALLECAAELADALRGEAGRG